MKDRKRPSGLLITIYLLLIAMGAVFVVLDETEVQNELEASSACIDFGEDLETVKRCVLVENSNALRREWTLGKEIEGVVPVSSFRTQGFNLYASMPRLEGVASADIEAKINFQIESLWNKQYEIYLGDFREWTERVHGTSGAFPSRYPAGMPQLIMRYEIEHPETAPRVLSVQLRRDWDLSMVHPANDIHNLIFDLETGNLLELSDMFADPNHEVAITYQERPQVDPKTIHVKISDLPHVMIADDGLKITFDYYSIGSRPFGQPEFLIPWEEIETAIDPDGPLGSLAK